MLNGRLLFLPFLGAAFLSGCHQEPFALADSVQLALFTPGPGDSLHLPYVSGAEIDLTLINVDASETSHFTMTSDAPQVFEVDSMDPSFPTAHCTAHAAGSATVHVRKDGVEVSSSEVSVGVPDHATLSPAGPLFVGQPVPFDATGAAKVVTNGTATFQVQYFAGATRLFGNGVLRATTDDTVTATPATTFFLQENEWLAVTPATSGAHAVTLLANDQPLATLSLTAVDASDVQEVSIETEDASNQQKGSTLMVLAQAFDAGGEAIFGANFRWNLAGEDQEVEGDLFEYPLDPSASNQLTASFGTHSISTSIDADPGTGTVGSSNNIGCSVGAVGSPTPSGQGEQLHGTILLSVMLASLALGGAASTRFNSRRKRLQIATNDVTT